MPTIHLLAQVTARPGREQDLEAAMLTLLKPTLREPGCRRYRLYASNRPGRLFVDEVWDSQEALDLHLKTPHFLAVAALHAELLEGKLELDFLREIDP